MRDFFKLSLFLIIFLLIAIFAMSSWINQATPSSVASLADKEEIITLVTPDNVTIRGSYIAGEKENSPAILMLHGNGGSRAQFKSHLQTYNAAGFAVFAVDLRGHGQSQDESKSYGVYESIDAYTAFDFLKTKQQGAKIGVLGLSLGGSAALIGKNGPLAADSMILQAVFPDIRHAIGNRVKAVGGAVANLIIEPLLSYQSYIRYDLPPEEISPIRAAAQYEGSVLLIGGSADIYTTSSEVKAMHDAMKGPKWLWIIKDLGHAEISGLDDDAYMDRTLAFFQDTLK